MKDEKILNGTGKGSDIESATKDTSAPTGAATGFIVLDGGTLAAVTSGFSLDALWIVCPVCGEMFFSVSAFFDHALSHC